VVSGGTSTEGGRAPVLQQPIKSVAGPVGHVSVAAQVAAVKVALARRRAGTHRHVDVVNRHVRLDATDLAFKLQL
jgi:hypothetical protein